MRHKVSKPKAPMAETSSVYTCGAKEPGVYAAIIVVGLGIMLSMPTYKKPILVKVGEHNGSFHETHNESAAYLRTGGKLEHGETVRYDGRVYRVIKQIRDSEWVNQYSLERMES